MKQTNVFHEIEKKSQIKIDYYKNLSLFCNSSKNELKILSYIK